MNIFSEQNVNTVTSALRLFLSLIAGGLIGLERESRHQPAGLRTHILICVGSTLLMLLSIYIPQQFFDMKNGDPGRIAAQVVSGIGFLGAGAILKLGINVKGLTTAATIWIAAGIGLAIGAGFYLPSLFALLIALFALVVLDNIEKYIFPPERVTTIHLYFDGTSVDTQKIYAIFHIFKIHIQSLDVIQSIKKEKVQVKLLVRVPLSTDIPDLYKEIRSMQNLNKIEMNEGR